ncbi:DUF4012 domain-containing protein [Cnuibacter physcomitrellae]|uniref:DUF4012 domain-containing protein n=1 Tax=Cnuibacter physcomitrellae TaxID=1619308 RepID=UPI0021759E05|nr:DUF4012 domain-containing protein [Cnuibacter physcomitrellae]MCS5496123.1 DUF4012 domain-containing protein [Cnuibacter physcomitrellae]
MLWVGVRGLMAKDHLEAAIPLAKSTQDQIVDGSTEGASADAQELADHARAAADLTSDPIWRAGELVPWVGPNLRAVRQAAQATDLVASGVVLPLASSVQQIGLSSFQPVDGKIALQPLLDVQQTVSGARQAVGSAADIVDDIDPDDLIPQVSSAVELLRASVDQANGVLIGVDNATQLIPAMLGAEGPRNYLLAFQNPAELRAGGGITSAMALIHTENGDVTLVQQASGADFNKFDPPIVQLPDETRGLFQDKAAQYVQNTTLVPQFELSGEIASTMWTDHFGGSVDGVISFDPVALSYLLEATGPIELSGISEQLDSSNAVEFLLSGVYARYPDPKVQDAAFAEVAKAVFDRVSAGDLDQKKLLDAMMHAGNEQRFKLWSAHPEEQAILAGTSLAGSLPVTTGDSTGVGLYFNDATGAKMDYYLTASTTTTSQSCRADGRPIIRVQTTLTNTAPADAAATLPEYVTGGGVYGVAPGNVSTYVYIYGPDGPADPVNASISLGIDAGIEGGQARTAIDQNHTVAEFKVELAPGESRTVTADFLAQAGDPLDVSLQQTPMVTPSVYTNEILPESATCEFG